MVPLNLPRPSFLPGCPVPQSDNIPRLFPPPRQTMKRQADRVVPQLLERRVGGSREKLRGVAQSRSREALEKLAELEAKLPEGTKVKIKPVLDSLEKAKQRATGAVVDVGDGKPMLYGSKGEVISRSVLGKSKS